MFGFRLNICWILFTLTFNAITTKRISSSGLSYGCNIENCTSSKVVKCLIKVKKLVISTGAITSRCHNAGKGVFTNRNLKILGIRVTVSVPRSVLNPNLVLECPVARRNIYFVNQLILMLAFVP